MSLRLHSKKGVNPHMTTCRNCGKSVGVALLGANDSIYKCKGCGSRHLGGRPDKKCPQCGGSRDQFEFVRRVEEHEALPIEMCDECTKRQDECNTEVKNGGIFWRCSDCGSTGALKAASAMAAEVRAKLNIPTGPCGIEFSKEWNCPICNKEEVPNE